jgi:hypothetical protein
VVRQSFIDIDSVVSFASLMNRKRQGTSSLTHFRAFLLLATQSSKYALQSHQLSVNCGRKINWNKSFLLIAELSISSGKPEKTITSRDYQYSTA